MKASWRVAVVRDTGAGLRFLALADEAPAVELLPPSGAEHGRPGETRPAAAGLSDRLQAHPDQHDYYPALAQANVRIVDQAIGKAREHAIVSVDGHAHPCDVQIYVTGFACTEFLAPMPIVGRNGPEQWRRAVLPAWRRLPHWRPHTNRGRSSSAAIRRAATSVWSGACTCANWACGSRRR